MARSRKRSSRKGTKSKTHPGRMNYTTKKSDKDYHQRGHDVKKSHTPYSKDKRTAEDVRKAAKARKITLSSPCGGYKKTSVLKGEITKWDKRHKKRSCSRKRTSKRKQRK